MDLFENGARGMSRRPMKLFEPLLISVLLSVGTASAGTEADAQPEPAASAGNWCDCLQDSLGLKSAGTEPWLWDMKLFGRLQWQHAYVDGTDANGDDFNYDTDEWRRFYFGGQARFLKYFQVVGRALFERDLKPLGGETEWGYDRLWDLGLKTDLKKLAGVEGLDALVAGYGKKQINVSDEWHISSKFLKTAERSAIANKVWPHTEGFANPTGGWVDLKKGAWKGTLGVFSTDHSTEFSSWDDGQLYFGEAFRTFENGTAWVPDLVNLAGYWQNVDFGDERLAAGIDWAASLAGKWDHGPWEFRANVIVGDNGEQLDSDREGAFWGVVLTPSLWIIPERLDVVMRYHYQGSEEEEGIRMWGRYARRAGVVGDADLGPTAGRGDAHHSVYLGLSTYLCGDNLKIMAGVEYDDISSGGEDVYKGWTSYLAVRTYF